jgi:hypothetical protein
MVASLSDEICLEKVKKVNPLSTDFYPDHLNIC